jgi:transcription-repair coupling factor (superfamily II helicase)
MTVPPEAIRRLLAAPELVSLAHAVRDHSAVSCSGLWGSSVAATVAALTFELNRPVLLVCGHLDEADDLADDVELFTGERPECLPAIEVAGSLGRVSEEQVSNRLRIVSRLASGKGEPNRVLITSIQALMQAVPARSDLQHVVRSIDKGQMLEPEKLVVWLSEHGYNRLDQVEVPGDFAVRGGIIDIYIPGDVDPKSEQLGLCVRIDFFGDQVETIRTFDPSDLGSRDTLQTVQLIDLRGKLDSGSFTHLFTYLPADTVLVLWAPLEIAEQARSYLDRVPDQRGLYTLSAVLKNGQAFAMLELSQFDQGSVAGPTLAGGREPVHHKLPVRSLQRFETEAKKALGELAELSRDCDATVFCENDGERKRLLELLEAEQPDAAKKLQAVVGYLHHGFVWGEDVLDRPLALLGHHELFNRYEKRRRVKKVIASRPVDSFIDLNVGDYVVHVAHGIAKFTGIQTLTRDGKSEEYLTLRFAESATLHVPASRINLIQKYIGGFSGHPQLSRLGSGQWEKQKEKVSEAVMDLAADLLEVQASRAAQPGYAFPPDSEWQKEFEAEFPYEPTPDQVTGSVEIKGDMSAPKPMDRLLCGDVGYGKTELAMRAAFKACEAGKQVAVLVPTTVLCEQHWRSFRERMASYPFAVESLSRWRSGKETREVLRSLGEGQVDVVIGTHRLLSKDVKFKDLGLVIVDEEQRFGVTHKERLKQLRSTVDVLTMSATPIPRTLHMSMLGLRDISSLTTAPTDRRSIVTEVMAYDRNRIKLAIQRELQREGQVYFLHNRVSDIQSVADEIQQMVPDARILVGHGQMEEGALEQVMLKFVRHEADILVATTIIESGLDIPNANTILINNADRFGLSELHQLRGRVGRWKHRAYCYLLLPGDRPVTDIASKRLKAIEEYSHLGSGFKIAMRDLELRGAGNILGPEQSGHIASVGYEMYCQLLEEAVRSLKNDPKPTRPEAHVEIGLTAFIPKQYVTNDRQRMDAYRRITRCESIEMVRELQDDLKDAFGELPRQAVLLFALTEVRILAGHFGIDSIVKQSPDIVLTVRDAQKAQFAMTGAPGRLTVVDEKTVYFRPPPVFMEPDTMLVMLRNLFMQAYERETGTPAVPLPATDAAAEKAGTASDEKPAASKPASPTKAVAPPPAKAPPTPAIRMTRLPDPRPNPRR